MDLFANILFSTDFVAKFLIQWGHAEYVSAIPEFVYEFAPEIQVCVPHGHILQVFV
jgi:hypothetical protein